MKHDSKCFPAVSARAKRRSISFSLIGGSMMTTTEKNYGAGRSQKVAAAEKSYVKNTAKETGGTAGSQRMTITEKNYVEKAEAAVLSHRNRKGERNRRPVMVTTSKIRNILSLAADISYEAFGWKDEILSDELCGRIAYLKVRILYEAGREPAVKDFVERAEIIKCIDEIGSSKKKYLLFNRYLEALVAYHRFFD